MKVYFYHTQDVASIYGQWKEGKYPGHLLYGATHLNKYGVDVIMHEYPPMYNHRLKHAFLTAWRILTCGKSYDVLYATSFAGLELIVMLRALRLFRKPVVLWHHQPIVKSGSKLREFVARLFYKGIDRMFFFSDAIIKESLKSSKADVAKMQMVHWGADMDFYDRVIQEVDKELKEKGEGHSGFISTGKERRDMPTLINSFSRTDYRLDIFVSHGACEDDYHKIIGEIDVPPNVHVNFIRGLIINELAHKVYRRQCVVICCKKTNYTVGLTTLVEALALGLPVVCTRNETFAIDIEASKSGIVVDYGDVDGWERAIKYIATHPTDAEEMGRNGRELSKRIFNLEVMAKEVAEGIKFVIKA